MPSEKDIKLLKMLLLSNETSLLKACTGYLTNIFGKENVYDKKDFVYAAGNIPILLVAHLDTVLSSTPIIYTNKDKTIWTSKQGGLGADDRAGVFAIMKLLRRGYRPSVLLTTGEESGGLGAMSFVKDFPEPPVATKYVIEIDRRGRGQAVFYDCGNQDFVDYVETFGFIKHRGIFSDISFICPQWDVAGVNLSAGYYHEHTEQETLKLTDLSFTIERVVSMLEDANNAAYFGFEGIEKNEKILYTSCKVCGKIVPYLSVINVRGIYTCPNCVNKFVHWCEVCNKPFFTAVETKQICEDCSNEEHTND